MQKIKSQAMFDYEKTLRIAICQYCLDAGHGIYDENRDYDIDDIKRSMRMTTAAEETKAKAENKEPRYVLIEAIEYFENYKRHRQVLELLKNGYYLIDWDEWQKLQDILGVELSYKSAKEIIDIFWEDTSVSDSLSVMDIWYNIHDPGSSAFLTKFINEFTPDTCRDKVVNALLNDGIDIYKLIESRKSDDCDMTNAKYHVLPYPIETPISW